MFFFSKYETFEVSSYDIEIRYFKNNIMIIFISELNRELIEVALMSMRKVFNKSVILSKLQQL